MFHHVSSAALPPKPGPRIVGFGIVGLDVVLCGCETGEGFHRHGPELLLVSHKRIAERDRAFEMHDLRAHSDRARAGVAIGAIAADHAQPQPILLDVCERRNGCSGIEGPGMLESLRPGPELEPGDAGRYVDLAPGVFREVVVLGARLGTMPRRRDAASDRARDQPSAATPNATHATNKR